MSEQTYTPQAKTLKVVDPEDPGAEAAALAWDKGVVSLTSSELVVDSGVQAEPQTVALDVGMKVVCLEPDGIVTVMSQADIDANWGS